MVLQFIFCIISIQSAISEWIQSLTTNKLPRWSTAMTIGAWNGTIWLLGGMSPNTKQLVEFDVSTQTFEDHAENILSSGVSGRAQYYAQIEHILYIIDWDQFSTFNMKTKQFIAFPDRWENVQIPIDAWTSCLAVSSTHLFVTGGTSTYGEVRDNVQMLDLETKQWTNVTKMLDRRAHFSCLVDKTYNSLYVISGYDDDGYVDSIEYIQTSNINENSWDYLGYLTHGALGTRCIGWKDQIWIIGGYYYDSYDETKNYLDTVHIINTTDGTISLLRNGSLPYGASDTALVIVDEILYAFGGDHLQNWTDWTMYDLLLSSSLFLCQKCVLYDLSTTLFISTSIPSVDSSTTNAVTTNILTTTHAPSTWTKKIFGDSFYIIIVAIIGGSLIVIICIVACYFKKKHKQQSIYPQIIISNPMILLIGIGKYDKTNMIVDAEINAGVKDLDVDIDIINLLTLFRDKLKYKTFPKYNDENPNIYWKQHDLINFLTEKAQIFEDNVATEYDNKFDGLLIVISSHGIDNNIITSDYKLISKDVIHRIFSSYHPKSRTMPRIIIYDCCEGDEDMKGLKNTRINKKRNIDAAKGYTITDIPVPLVKYDDDDDIEPQPLWERFTKNPDYRLVTIHAANKSFQSKINKRNGSYLIHNFVSKMLDIFQTDSNNQPFIHEIFDEIQDKLGEKKQLPICTYNNNMRFIKFGYIETTQNEVELQVMDI